MSKNMIARISTDRARFTQVSRHFNESVEFSTGALKYGDLSEVCLTVWADGKVHQTVKDEQGNTVDSHSFGRDRNTESPKGWDQVTA